MTSLDLFLLCPFLRVSNLTFTAGGQMSNLQPATHLVEIMFIVPVHSHVQLMLYILLLPGEDKMMSNLQLV